MKSEEKNIIIFIVLRVLDAISTLLSTNEFGFDLETNPVSRFWLERGLFLPYQILVLVVSCLFFVKLKNNKPIGVGLILFNIVTAFVVTINFISYFIAKGFL